MDIRYFSDLHLEFMNLSEFQTFTEKMSVIPVKDNTVCILAGDIGHPEKTLYNLFFRFIHQHFPKTFVIPGNHEYYHKKNTVEQTDKILHDYFQQYGNITLLNNSCENYRGVCFIGSVLWSHISNPSRTINDINHIPELNTEKYNALNKTCVDFLQQGIDSNENCIIITHHMPSEQLIHPKYRTSHFRPYNQWFYCDVENLFLKDRVKAWIYGHTHTCSKTAINGVPFYCNPGGYVGEDSGFNFDAHFSV